MKKAIFCVITAVFLCLSLAATAGAFVGNSWFEDGSAELDTRITADGEIKMFGAGDFYPYEFIGFKDKVDINGFSVKLDMTLWETTPVNDAFTYIALGDSYKDGCDAIPGVGTFINLKNGVILKFARYTSSWATDIPDNSVIMVFYLVKDGNVIDYGNEFSNVIFEGQTTGEFTVSFAKNDGKWQILVNDTAADYLASKKAGKPGDGKPNLSFLDTVFADGKAYFTMGAVPYAAEEVSFTLKTINGIKAAEFLAEGGEAVSSVAASSQPASSETTGSAASTPVSSAASSSTGCGNKA